MEGIFTAWGRILAGYKPSLSIEITRECPLRCPGCYAYGDEHLGGGVTLRQVSDYKGDELVAEVLRARRRAQAAASFDRRRRAAGALPRVEHDPPPPRRARHLLAGRHERRAADSDRVGGIAPAAARRLDRRTAARARRAPHARDLRSHPQAHRRTPDHRALHRHAAAGARDGYLEEFIRFWSENENVRTIWVSLYTPQIGEVSEEQLRPEDRARVVGDLMHLRRSLSEAADAGGHDQGLPGSARRTPTTASSR